MLRPGPLMKSETIAQESECQRLQLLVGELLLKNHQLRCEVGRLHEALEGKAPRAKKGADASSALRRVEDYF